MKRDQIKEYFEKVYKSHLNQRTLLEQEEELELFGDEDAEGGEKTPDIEEDADDEAADDAGDTETEVENEDNSEVKIEAGDEVRLGKQFDVALDSILADYEMNALKSAQIYKDAKEEIQNEWKNKKLSKLIFEQEDQVSENDLDIDLFSEDVARLIKNYEVLMDMESVIFNKAKEFLIIKYGQDVADAFSEILKVKHGYDFDSEIEDLEDIESVAPLAVGSGGSGAGAA